MAVSDWDAVEPAENRQETTELFHILSNSRRRHVIRAIDLEGPLNKSAVTDYVATQEFDAPIEEIETKERRRVHTALHQTHLETLQEADVIALEGIVQEGERFNDFATFLERSLIKAGVIEPPSLVDRLKEMVF